MADYYIDIPMIDDRSVYNFFGEVARLLNASGFSLTERGGQAIELEVEPSTPDPYFSNSKIFSIHMARASGTGFMISLTREHTPNKELHFDKLRLHRADNQASISNETLRKINDLISRTFFPSSAQSSSLFSNPKIFETLIKSHQEMLARLESTTTSITESMVAARAQLEQEFLQRQSVLEDSFQQRQLQAEEVLAEVRSSLSQREIEIEERRKELDDRDHIHARRQLREQITVGIAERLKGALVPVQTSAIGTIVFILAIIGSAALGFVSFISFREFSDILASASQAAGAVQNHADQVAVARAASASVWFLLARGFLASIGSVVFLVYAISWLKNLYHDRVRAHQELERYSIDLNRASWAVETIMEAKASGGAIPDILIAGLSKNLFDTSSGKVSPSSDGDTLSSLLRASARAKIGPTGAEFEMNGRGARRLADRLDD